MQRDDQLAANRAKLDALPDAKEIARDVQIGDTSRVTGSVRIGNGTVINNCIVRGPAIIGANCNLKDTYIGPYTTLGDGVEIAATEIENSSVADNVVIQDIKDRIQDSVIGPRAKIARVRTEPAVFRFCIDADSQVEIPAHDK